MLTQLLDTIGRRNRTIADRNCNQCGKQYRPRRSTSRYCSRPCMWKNNGGHNKKKETWWISARGYIEGRVWMDEHTQVCCKQHRYIMEKHLDRRLLPDEDVHHIDGNKTNNDIDNLQVINHGEHASLSNVNRGKDKEEQLCKMCEKNIPQGDCYVCDSCIPDLPF